MVFLQLYVDKPITIHCIFRINSLFKPKEKSQTSETNLQRYCGSWRMQMSQGEQVNQHLDAISVHDLLHVALVEYQLVEEAYQTISLQPVCTLCEKKNQQKYNTK